MKYQCKTCPRKRIVDAVQITEQTFTAPIPNPEHVPGVVYDPINWRAIIKLTGARLVVNLGDWIIIEEDGEVAMCLEKAFGENYILEEEWPTSNI